MILYIIGGIVLVAVGFFIGVNNPTAGAAAKKIAKEAQAATAEAVGKLKS